MLASSADPWSFLVAQSGSMQAVKAQLAAWAETDAPVLICGEHGTGRELIARVLHNVSSRRGKRFVSVRPTFESSDVPVGAREDRATAALIAADKGTLLIKDVCDASRSSQRVIKRALRRPIDDGPDVRIVATSDEDFDAAVEAEILSRELHDRLSEHRIDVPALRDRREDVPELFERWAKHYAAEVGRESLTLATACGDRLKQYSWPGNVAELKAIARRLITRTRKARIEAGDVEAVLPLVALRVPLEDISFEEMVKAKVAALLGRMDGYSVSDLYEKIVTRVERPLFDLVMTQTSGNQLRAAQMLGLSRNTLRKKLAECGVRLPKSREGRLLDAAKSA